VRSGRCVKVRSSHDIDVAIGSLVTTRMNDLLHDIDWVTILGSGDAKAFVYAVTATVDHLLESERGLHETGDDVTPGRVRRRDAREAVGEEALHGSHRPT
jgi:hypothetical protein